MKGANSSVCPSDEEIGRAVQAIREGGIIAVPTETYYGLAADPENEEALRCLFSIKQRPKNKPILLLISKLEQLEKYAAAIPESYQPLIDCYWPGPLTLVFPAKPVVSPLLTGGSGTIGIRLTPNPVACRIIDQLGKAITATSVNLSGQDPARTAQQVRALWGARLDYVVDGGPADKGPGSTVVRIVEDRLCIERTGRVFLPGLPECPK